MYWEATKVLNSNYTEIVHICIDKQAQKFFKGGVHPDHSVKKHGG